MPFPSREGVHPSSPRYLQFGELLCFIASVLSVDQLRQQKFLELRPLGAPRVEETKGGVR